MNRIDEAMDDMSNTKFLAIFHTLIKQASNSSSFVYNDIRSMLIVYYKFVMANGPRATMMTKKQLLDLFLVLFRIYDIRIINRILLSITKDVKFVSPEAWLQLISVFLTDNLKARIDFAYQVYTGSGANILTREEVSFAVEKFFPGDDDDEVLELRADMCEFIINKFDEDKDGIISYEEYTAAVLRQPQLLEFLGKIFPDEKDLTLIIYCTNIESLFQKVLDEI